MHCLGHAPLFSTIERRERQMTLKKTYRDEPAERRAPKDVADEVSTDFDPLATGEYREDAKDPASSWVKPSKRDGEGDGNGGMGRGRALACVPFGQKW